MKNKTIHLIAVFLSSISVAANATDNNLKNNSNNKLIIQPSKEANKIPFNFIKFLTQYNSRNNSKDINIEKTSKELVNLSHDDYFLDQASRVNAELQIVISDAKLNKNIIDKKSENYLALRTDSQALQKYVKENYPDAYHSFELISKDKSSIRYLKQISPANLITGSPAVSTNVYANVEAAANVVAVSNAAAATNVFVAAEVFVVIAAVVI